MDEPPRTARVDGSTSAVELFSWNPSRPVLKGRIGKRVGWERPLNNFGDLLGPVLVRALLRREGIDPRTATRPARLLSVGSVLHFARLGDVVWGSGVNGKVDPARHSPDVLSTLDVRAVRGPRTREFLQARGVSVPAVFGDPGLLVPDLIPEIAALAGSKRYDLSIVPNLNDTSRPRPRPAVVDPRRDLMSVLARIAQSRLVVGSSLHGIIVAESMGIPARLVMPEAENDFKYHDYYEGTGRTSFRSARTVAEAVDLGGESPAVWSSQALVDAFPRDLWDH